MTITDKTDSPATSAPTPKSRSFRRRVLSRISIQSKLLAMLLVTSVLSAAVVGAHRLPIRTFVIAGVGVRPADRDSRFAVTPIGVTVLRPEEFARHLHPRGHRRPRRSRHSPPAFDQLNDSTINPAQWQSIVNYYSNQFAKAEDRPDRQRRRRRCAAARRRMRRSTCRPTTPRRSTTGTRRSTSTTPGTAARGRRPTPGSTTSSGRSCKRFDFEDALLLDTRGQRRLHRLQGRRPRHQRPHRPVP